MTCPRCGNTESKGKFCSNCGAALSGAACRQCGSPITPGARFCHVCATPVGAAAGRSGVPGWVPWTVGGVVAAVLIVAAIAVQRSSAPPEPARVPTTATGTTDISQMSPRERANRLFDRVMRSSEAGDTTDVRFFAPMAIQAHEMMGTLDADARYHLGLIHMVAGDPASAVTQGDSILATIPTHLYGFMLRAQAARALGNATAARQADAGFLRNYEAESGANRPEYQEHPGLIERYRTEAQSRN